MITEQNIISLAFAMRIYESEILQAKDDPGQLEIARNSFLGKLKDIFIEPKENR